MTFFDFKLSELPGQQVVWTTTDTPNKKLTKIITKISQALKEGFRIEGYNDKLFSYRTGHEILNSERRKVFYGTISKCEIVTLEEAEDLKIDWMIMNEKKDLINIIIGNKDKMFKLNADDLRPLADKLSEL